MEIVWIAFNQLNSTRTSNGFGFNPISYFEICSWINLTKFNLTPNEIEVLKLLDNKFLIYSNKSKEEK